MSKKPGWGTVIASRMTRGLGRNVTALVCAATTTAACDRTTPTRARAVTDDARVPLEASVDIGGQGGPYELSEVVGVATLSDGRFIIGNRATNDIRVFSPTGSHLMTVGRTGGGPGEFYGLSWIGVASADTILAYDLRSRRLSWFAPNGKYVRGSTIDTGMWSGSVIGRFADGSFVVTSNRYPLPRARPAGLVVDSIVLSRVSADANRWARLGAFPGWQQFWTGSGAAGVGFGLPVFRKLHVIVCDSAIVAGYPDRPHVSWVSSEGQRLGELDLPLAERAISPAEREQIIKARTARASADFRPRIEAAIEAGGVVPHSYPPFAALGGDTVGTLWVALPAVGVSAPTEWVRYAPNAAVIDTVRLAPRSRFAAVAGDRLFVIARDEDDVEHVLAYRIPKSAAAGGYPPASDPERPTGCHRGFYSALTS